MGNFVEAIKGLNAAQIIGLSMLGIAVILRVASLFFHHATGGAMIPDDSDNKDD